MSVTSKHISNQRVRFGDCDPAGIAYFPRLLALVDNAVEDWLVAAIGVDRAAMHLGQQRGLPTVDLTTHFAHPCRLGETLAITITATHVGATSITLAATAQVDHQPRFSARLVQVLIDLETGKPCTWPTAWRGALAPLPTRQQDVSPA